MNQTYEIKLDTDKALDEAIAKALQAQGVLSESGAKTMSVAEEWAREMEVRQNV